MNLRGSAAIGAGREGATGGATEPSQAIPTLTAVSNRTTHPSSRLSSRGSASASTEGRDHARTRTPLNLGVEDAMSILSRMAEGCMRRLPGRGTSVVAAHLASASSKRSGVWHQAKSDSLLECRSILRRGTCRGSLADQQLASRKSKPRPGDRCPAGGRRTADAHLRAPKPLVVACGEPQPSRERLMGHDSSWVRIALATAWTVYAAVFVVLKWRDRNPRRG